MKPNYPLTNVENLSPREGRHLLNNVIVAAREKPALPARCIVGTIVLAVIAALVWAAYLT